MSRNCYSNDQIAEHQLQTNDDIDLDSTQSIAYSTYSMMASNDFLARKLNYKETKRRIMVYWKLHRRYQVGTDIWEPRTSVKHFSLLSCCISWPQAENTISNSTLKLHLLRTALRRGILLSLRLRTLFSTMTSTANSYKIQLWTHLVLLFYRKRYCFAKYRRSCPCCFHWNARLLDNMSTAGEEDQMEVFLITWT